VGEHNFVVLEGHELRGLLRAPPYFYRHTESAVEIIGLWPWQAELPAPLVTLYDYSSGQLLGIVEGKYGEPPQSLIRATLPKLGAGRLKIGLSQTGEIAAQVGDQALEVRLIDRPSITGVTPSVFDIRHSEPFEVQLHGEGFHKDGVGPAVLNLECRVNGQKAEVRYYSSTVLGCTLTPDFTVEVYVLSVSTNFGHDWVAAEATPVQAVALPEISWAAPTLLSANLMTTLRVDFTASGTTDTELREAVLDFAHFTVISKKQVEARSVEYVLLPKGARPNSAVQVNISLPHMAFSFTSEYTGLEVLGATTLLASTPQVAIRSLGWLEVELTGSHFEVQPLYCFIAGNLHELEALSSTRGRCLISLERAGDQEVRLLTKLGEQVPGNGRLSILSEELSLLWPRIESAIQSWDEARLVHLQGDGFRANQTFCDFESGQVRLEVQADVRSPSGLSCPVPSEFAALPVVAVYVRNVVADDLSEVLRSQRVQLESDPAIWTLTRPTADISEGPKPTNRPEVEEEVLAELVAYAEETLPVALLAGETSGPLLNLESISSERGLQVSACIFGQKRVHSAGLVTS